ncbi:MAG: thiamine pyrophosphate-binding protein [Blautia sp.]
MMENLNCILLLMSDPQHILPSGLAEESQEPVVICCTGATASRNYMPGLTEAYYRKLPVIAVTATRPIAWLGQNRDQLIDRTVIPKDIAVKVYIFQ